MMLRGAEIPTVDCIVGGSPCQDLSVAGNRAGLEGARSGLFMEQVRVVKEMRQDTDGKYPRFMVWENVPGAFSSNKGGDFRTVLEEIVRIAEPEAVIPEPPKGKWDKAGAILGDGYSVAWRTHDAQYWGVPQRRRRISLVADFTGGCAGEILFECEGVSGNLEPGRETREGTARDSKNSTAGDDRVVGIDGYNQALTGGVSGSLGVNCGMSTGRNGVIEKVGITRDLIAFAANQRDEVRDVVDKAVALQTEPGMKQQTFIGVHCYNPADPQSKRQYDINGSFCTLSGYGEKSGGNNQGAVYCIDGAIARQAREGSNGKGWREDTAFTVNTLDIPAVACMAHGQANAEITDGDTSPTLNCNHEQPIVVLNDQGGASISIEKRGVAPTLRSEAHQHEPVVCYDMTHASDVIRDSGEVSPTLQNRMGTGGNQIPITTEKRTRWIVRRLTPLECERLQGFPDGWTDIGEWVGAKWKVRKTSDTHRYKALGNSIALPFWLWMFQRMEKHLPEKATLGSLFDGIGGFPLCWERIHGKGTALWASEIEEFPIAVTSRRF